MGWQVWPWTMIDAFTALPGELGLKVETQKDPIEVLVIDHAELPSPN